MEDIEPVDELNRETKKNKNKRKKMKRKQKKVL
jgi:hypothetical protein